MRKSNNHRSFVVVLASCLLSIFAVGQTPSYGLELPIGAKSGQKKMDMPRLKASLDVMGAYSDNVNALPGRDSKGMQFRVTPDIGVEAPQLGEVLNLGKRRLFLGGGYRYGYIGTNGRKIDFHEHAHTANAQLRYAITDKAALGSEYVFKRDQYPFVAAGDTFTINDVVTQLKVELTKKLTLEPYYHFQNFNDSGFNLDSSRVFQDYGLNTIGWNTTYALTPKVSVIGNSEYQHKAFRATNLKDFYSYGGIGGLSVQLTKKITVRGAGGYLKRYFRVGKDLGSPKWDVNLQYIPTRKVVVNLFYNYDLVDTILTADFLTDRALEPNVADLIPRNYRGVTVQRPGASLGLTLTDKDRIDTSFIYQFANASSGQNLPLGAVNTKLNENDYQYTLSYAHAFAKWLSLTLNYTNLGRNTNIANNFRANVFGFGVHMGW